MEAKNQKRRVRKVYVLPNLLTAFNVALGVLAVINVLNGNLPGACWLIVVAAILDGLDGAIARLTHTQSEFGRQFDSLADFVSFGVAPATVAYYAMRHDLAGFHPRLMTAICGLFAICGALRLARYNVQATSSEKRGFIGLPIPCAGGCVAMLALLIRRQILTADARALLPLEDGGVLLETVASAAYPFIVLALALLMVSEVPYPCVNQVFRLRMSFDSLVSAILLAFLIWALQSDDRVVLLCLLGYGYVFYGLIVAGVRRLGRRPAPEAASPRETG